MTTYREGLLAAARVCRELGAQGDPVRHYACHDCADAILALAEQQPAEPGPETVSVPRDVVVAAERKLRLVASIYPGDKESRRLADELLAAVSAK